MQVSYEGAFASLAELLLWTVTTRKLWNTGELNGYFQTVSYIFKHGSLFPQHDLNVLCCPGQIIIPQFPSVK